MVGAGSVAEHLKWPKRFSRVLSFAILAPCLIYFSPDRVEAADGRLFAQGAPAPATVAPASAAPAPGTSTPGPSTPGTPATDAPEPIYKRHTSPPRASVYLEYPTNGAVVPPTFKIRFGLVGMGVAPAGFDRTNTGHHHLLVDVPLPAMDIPVSNDFNHLHFALGQTEAMVTLPVGPHTLQLLFADANHVPHDPPLYSKPIQILVTADGKRPHSARHSHRHSHRR